MNPLTELSLDQLRQRRSIKWRFFEPDVLPLWVAEMDTPLAEPIADALAAAISRGDTGYADPGGLADAWCGFSAARFGWAPDPARFRLIPDVMRGVHEVLRAITPSGSGVVINPPVYHPFYPFIEHSGRRVVEVPLRGHDDGAYTVDLDRLAAAFARPDVAAYLMCNPHNPTGTVFPVDTLRAVAELAHTHDVRFLVDEIHAPLAYPGGAVPVPFLSLVDSGPAEAVEAAARAFVFTSASKAWNLPGLKAALVFAGPAAADDMAALPVEVSFGAGLLGVIAGEAALRYGQPWLDALRSGLASNRALLTSLLADRLPAVRYRQPDATYLSWLDCRALNLGDDPAAVFLDRGRVAVNPGPQFGFPGRGFVRLNFAAAPDVLTEAVHRMAACCRPE